MYFRCCLHTVSLISLLCSSFVLYLPVPTCVCFVQFLILMSFSITFASFPPHLLALHPHTTPPPICCLHSFPFSLVHLHSCSFPCHSVSFSIYFLSCLFPLYPLSHLFQCQWGEVVAKCHFYIAFTMKEHCSAQKEICGNIWHRHTTEGYSVPLVHTDVTPEYSWG